MPASDPQEDLQGELQKVGVSNCRKDEKPDYRPKTEEISHRKRDKSRIISQITRAYACYKCVGK